MGPWIEALEPRAHFSLSAYHIGDALPAPRRYVVDTADRLNLLAQLAGSSIGAKLATLSSKSATFASDFDAMLLAYMKSRTSPVFDFAPADVPNIVKFIKDSADPDQQKLYNTEVLGTSTPALGITPAKPVADKATTNESLVRKGVRYYVYNFLIGGALYPAFTPVQKLSTTGLYIDWLSPRLFGKLDSATATEYLQRLPFLPYTAMAYRFLGNSSYGETIANALYTWAGQAPPMSQDALLQLYKPAGAKSYSTTIPSSVPVLPSWAALVTGVRVYPLLTMYNLMLGTAAWTPELNTLFLTLMYQHGRVLGDTARALYVNEGGTYGVDANPLGRTDNNKSLQLCGALLTMSRMFPEFAATKDAGTTADKWGWTSAAKQLLKDSIGRNYRGKYNSYAGGVSWKFDGFHKEMSPGYSTNMAETFINQLKLSQINGGANDPFLKGDPELRQLLTGEYVIPNAQGVADPAGAIPLATRVEALYQIINPDGTAPSVGDTPRPSLAGTFLRAQQVLPSDSYARNHEYTWPTKYPSLLDVFWLWRKDIQSVASGKTYGQIPVYNRYQREGNVPRTVASANRPNSPAKFRSWLPGAGYYMLRSDKGTRDDVQLTFDTGLMGLPNYNAASNTAAHTQFDLLNFELYGYQRPLIEDPGLVAYGNSRERNWIATTVAHNSFTVDNYSHARMDGYFGVIGPDENSKGVSVTGFHYGYQGLDGGKGPALARTIWFDKDNTFLVVDWGHQTTTNTHNYKISFTLPAPPTEANQAAASKAAPVSLRAAGDPSQGVFTQGPHGNVFILPLKYKRNPAAQKVGFTTATQDAGGTVTGPFVTAADFSGAAAPADRLYVTQSGSGANFVTMLHVYPENKNKDQVIASAVAEIISQSASTVTVRVTKNGISKDIAFTNPFNAGLAPQLAAAAPPTNPTTVWPRSTNPITGGYPDWFEKTEGAAPRDLNGGKFFIGPGDDAIASALPSSLPAMFQTSSPFSDTSIRDKEQLESLEALLAQGGLIVTIAAMATHPYLQNVESKLEAIEKSQAEAIKKAGAMIADAYQDDRLIHVYGGGGHTVMMVCEMFFRAGGLANVNPIFGHDISPLCQALKYLEIERTTGYGACLIRYYQVAKDDLLIVFHNIGYNPTTIDAVEEAKKRGAKIIAVSSTDWQKKLPKDHHIRHPNGKHLFDYADLKIDDANPFGDADYYVEGYDVPVAPTSTIVDAYIAHRMIIEAVAEMKKRGLEPPIFRSANLPGGDEFNAKLIERYRNRVKDL